MATITISKKEYQKLLDKALRYEYLRQLMEGDIFSPPPTKNIGEIISAFRATKRYNQQFINALEKGLRRSSYFKK
ncbi:hypothetical protein COW77_02130 [Candidatus Wolfebacteria bacterium CG18_big_fil_WC_8_21_14_2_50_39_7]|uniref:Uncharacterized protein n=1 Tax=Candidatus Wolfebacteria bacterium CG18_big_fil_WC_8_21_14_2_50_39_7 TaxID=1975071 RepID=A0A2H0EC89_9BACT|nr:MAG: hypothetical protein COW77_02130 [Candidatus Wolfebacteria bacterium CG18_big_fil_WC_8_21_14_2_50_39_7]